MSEGKLSTGMVLVVVVIVVAGKGFGGGFVDPVIFGPVLKKSLMDIGPGLGFEGFGPAIVVLLKKKGKTGAIAQLIAATIVKIRMKVFIFIFIDSQYIIINIKSNNFLSILIVFFNYQ